MRELSKIDGLKAYLFQPDIIDSLTESSVVEATDKGEYYGNNV